MIWNPHHLGEDFLMISITRLGAPVNDQNVCDNINRILESINEMKDPLEQIQHFSYIIITDSVKILLCN